MFISFGLGRNEYPIDLSQIKPENYNRLTPQNHEGICNKKGPSPLY